MTGHSAHQRTTLGIDAGSHGIRAVVLRGKAVRSQASATFPGARPPVRRDFTDIWSTVMAAVAELDPQERARVEAISVTGVRGSAIAIDRTGPTTPLFPDFDEATTDAAADLFAQFGDEMQEHTGCPAFPLAGLPKILAHRSAPGQWVSIQDAIAWRMTGELWLSAGSALRLGVLTRSGTSIDSSLLKLVGIDDTYFPALAPIGASIGTLTTDLAAHWGIAEGTPLHAAAGDGSAALASALVLEHYLGNRHEPILVSLGTSTVVSTCRNPDIDDRRVGPGFTREIVSNTRRSIETGDGAGMINVDWLNDLLDVRPGDLDALAAQAEPHDEVTLDLPALDVWGDRNTGSITGFDRSFGRPELARAVLHFVADSAIATIERVRAEAGNGDYLVLTGGGARSRTITDRIARRIGLPIVLHDELELAAIGAALVLEVD